MTTQPTLAGAPARLVSTRGGKIHAARVSTLTGFFITACDRVLRPPLNDHSIGPTCLMCRARIAR